MFSLAGGVLLVQVGYFSFAATLPVVLAREGLSDPLIGLVVGLAAVAQLPAAFVAGPLVAGLGAWAAVMLGAGAYLIAALALSLPVALDSNPVPILTARLLQGFGFAIVLPAALALVASLDLRGRREEKVLAFVASAHSLTLLMVPPIALALADAGSLQLVASATAIAVFGGALLTVRVRGSRAPEVQSARTWVFFYRRVWTPLIAITFLSTVYWAVAVTYLPQRADRADVDIALFFVADGVGVVLFRFATGWLSTVLSRSRLCLFGLSLMLIAAVLLFVPPSTLSLIASGALGGAGAGMVLTIAFIELAARSTLSQRGSAYAFLSAALAASLLVGSIGVAPLLQSDFTVALAVGVLALLVAVFVTNRALPNVPPKTAS
jgi:MFS family permease